MVDRLSPSCAAAVSVTSALRLPFISEIEEEENAENPLFLFSYPFHT